MLGLRAIWLNDMRSDHKTSKKTEYVKNRF